MLSDRIEKFILELLNKQNSEELFLKRKEVADLLECAPSQVTYVINTRFSSNERFIVESRRGNGGYIRIALRSSLPSVWKIPTSHNITKPVADNSADAKNSTSSSIEKIENELKGYYQMLLDYEIITLREYRMICSMMHTLLEYCPDHHRRDAAKTMIKRIEWVMKGE